MLLAAGAGAAVGRAVVELSRVFKAMGDPVRLRLLSLIASHAGGEACVCDLTDVFDLTGPTICHHLKVLREAGLITGERRGTWVYYRVSPALRRLSAVLAARRRCGGGGVSAENAVDRPRARVSSRSSPPSTGSCRSGSSPRWPSACSAAG